MANPKRREGVKVSGANVLIAHRAVGKWYGRSIRTRVPGALNSSRESLDVLRRIVEAKVAK